MFQLNNSQELKAQFSDLSYHQYRVYLYLERQ